MLYKPEDAAAANVMLQKEVQNFDHWDNLLKERSKAWVSMELLTQVVPEDSSVILTEASHTSTQETLQRGARRVGLKKEWIISGYASDAGMTYLRNLSSQQGIEKLFTEVANATGNSAYLPGQGKRELTATLGRSNAGMLPPELKEKLKNGFRLTITQSFAADDEMAIAGVEPPTVKR